MKRYSTLINGVGSASAVTQPEENDKLGAEKTLTKLDRFIKGL